MMPYVITAYNTLLPIFAAALYLLNICLDLIVNLEVIWWCPVFAAHGLLTPCICLLTPCICYSHVYSLFFFGRLIKMEGDGFLSDILLDADDADVAGLEELNTPNTQDTQSAPVVEPSR